MNETGHTFKVLDVHCKLTGTEDYGTYDSNLCGMCTYREMCTAESKVNKDELAEAREMYYEALKMADEAEAIKKRAYELFDKNMKKSGLVKYQFDNLVINNVWVKESVTYPKAKLLKVFSPEELEPASEIKEAYSYTKVSDLLKSKSKEV